MATILACYPLSPPTGDVRGTKTPSYAASWYVEVDEVVPGGAAIALARADIGLPTPYEPLPAHGESLSWTTSSGFEYTDASAFALDFAPKLTFTEESDEPRAWTIEVVWREPEPGQDEQPGTISKPPLQRNPENWIEYEFSTEARTRANLVTDPATGALGGEFEMVNGAGDPFPEVIVERIRPVLVIAKNVSSPTVAFDRNETFENSVSSVDFLFLGRTIKKHHARYLRSVTGKSQYFQGAPYYRMQTRIEVSKTPYYLERFNQGELIKSPFTGKKLRVFDDVKGVPVPGPYPLTLTGDLAETEAQYHTYQFLVYNTQDFRDLF